jgi:tetratricopeptide (TPR) repeat protein
MPEWYGTFEALVAGIAAVDSGDYDRGRAALEATEGIEFPEAIAGMRLVLVTWVDLADGRYEEVAARIEDAGDVDIPLLDLAAAGALNELGKHERALAHALRYLAEVGEDPVGRGHEGVALVGLGRDEEAVIAFRAGLDEDPRLVDLLSHLGRALPPGGKGELGPRLLATGDPAGSFEPVVIELLEDDETEAVEVLVAALREAVPSDPNADYYEAELLARDGRHAEAAALLADALPRVADADELLVYQGRYLQRMADAGRPLEGYEHLEGTDHAFEELAEHLDQSGNGTALLELTRRHGEHDPGHPRLALARARALALLGRREEADAAFAEAIERAGEDEQDALRYERVLNLFEAGQWRRAYLEVPPADSAFADLAWMMDAEGDLDDLEQLIALHRDAGAGPDDVDLAFWSVELPWLRGRNEATLEQLQAHEALLCASEDVSDLYYWEDRYVRCCLRLGRLDEATQRALAIDERDDDPFYTALVHAAAGREEQAAAALRRAIDQAWDAWELYDDADLGPLLRAEGAGALREVVPPPEEDTGG